MNMSPEEVKKAQIDEAVSRREAIKTLIETDEIRALFERIAQPLLADWAGLDDNTYQQYRQQVQMAIQLIGNAGQQFDAETAQQLPQPQMLPSGMVAVSKEDYEKLQKTKA